VPQTCRESTGFAACFVGSQGGLLNVTDGGHSTFETIGSTYRFVFPYRKEWLYIVIYGAAAALVLFFLPEVLCFGSGPEQISLTDLAAGGFLVLALMGLMLLEIMWQLAGKEVAEISVDEVIIRHHIFGLGPSKRFPAAKVSGLFVSRINSWSGVWWVRDYRFFNFKRGRVALNSGKNLLGRPVTYRFGTSLNEGEATQVVTQILGRFPQYRVADGNPHP
jgi:hypothetical protein